MTGPVLSGLQRARYGLVALLGGSGGALLLACAGLLGYERAELEDPQADAGASPDGAATDGGVGTPASDSSAYAKAVLADRPLSYWRLEDPPGSTQAKDERGFANAHVSAANWCSDSDGARPTRAPLSAGEGLRRAARRARDLRPGALARADRSALRGRVGRSVASFGPGRGVSSIPTPSQNV